MNHPRRRQLLLALITLVTIGSTALVAAAGRKAPPNPEEWMASWATALSAAGAGKSTTGFTNQTVRMFVHTSVGGSKARIRLSNRFGKQPVTIAHATVGLPFGPNGGPGDLKPGSIKDVTFFGQRGLTIPVGGNAVSDPIDMTVPANQDLAVSLFFAEATGPATWHLAARETTYFGEGNQAASASGAQLPETRTSWFFLSGVDVLNRNGKGTIAILGDSITDSFKSTVNADKRFSDLLSSRLNREAPGGQAPGVINLGMAGNRLSKDGTELGFPELGVNTSARFYSDVAAQTGVRAVIILMGINDIWMTNDSANNIIAQLQQLTALAKQNGMRVYLCTIMPWNGYMQGDVPKYTPALDSIRLTVNSYIRTSSDFDGVIDLDAAMRNPADPSKLRAEYDSGDHIHPNDAGNEAMANAVPLEMVL